MALGFAITPEQRRAFEADQWAQPHLEALADDWQAQALDRLNQPPTPSDSLTNPLGTGNMSAGPETDIVSSPSTTSPSPAAPDQPAPAPLPPALPAPDAPPPTDYGPVPRVSTQRPIAAPSAVPSPTVAPTPSFTQTTAGLSGGGASAAPTLTDHGQAILSTAGGIASWLGEQGQKALQAVLVTEGGLNNARGDSGMSAGPLQFYEKGQLANFARERGLTLEQAKAYVEQNPEDAIAWAIGTPNKPGYLGAAILNGISKGLTGADLATHAQRTGQVSVSPERAGQNYNALFSGGSRLFNVPAGQTVASAPVTTNLSLSQFGDQTLTADEAYSACGPAAAARLAAEYGNAIPLSAALAAAKTTGWTQAGGMNGILNEKKLLDALGLPAELDTSKDWNKIIQGASAGQLVTISTPGHYFQANAARQRSDGQIELYVGQSGKDLKVGKEWMTPGEMEAAMGALNGALFSDPSKAVTAGDWYQGAIRDHGIPQVDPNAVIGEIGQAAKKAGLSPAPDETVSNPFGEAFRQIGAVKDQVGGALAGAGEQFARNVTGTNPNQAEINQRFAGASALLPTSPMDVAGAGLGAPTSGELLAEQRNRAIAEQNPLRDVPVIGGATTFAAQTALDPTNLLLMGEPGVARGVGRVAGEAGTAVRELATAPETQALLRTRQRAEGINPFDAPPLNPPVAPTATQAAGEANTVRQLSAWMPKRDGPPGISVEPQGWLGTERPGMGTNVVFRDASGQPQGILAITKDASGAPDVAEIAVNPEFQRQGIATRLYEAAKDAGIDVEAITGRGGYTPEGAAFAQSRIDRGLTGAPVVGAQRLSQEEATTAHEMLGQQWTDLDNQAALLEAQSAAAFNPGLRQQLANEANRVRAQQSDIMDRADYLMEHGVLPSESHAPPPFAEAAPEAQPAAVATAPRAPSPSAVQSTAILSNPNYRRLQVMRGTAEQQAQLRPAEEGFAGNINLEKITPDGVKAALQRTMDSPSTGEFAGQRRGVITDTQAVENAATKALSMSPADWIKTKPGRAFNQEEALALGNQMVRTGSEYDAMRADLAAHEAAGDATDLMRAAVADKSLEFALLEGVRSGAAAEAGRALRSFRQVLDGALQTKNGDTSKALRAALKVLGGEDAYTEWAQKWSALDPADTLGKYAMLQALHQPSRMQKLLAWTTSNMLSGTKTLEVNLTGGAIETLNRPAIELLGGRPGDAWTDLTAMGRAIGEAWGNAGTTITTGIRPSRAVTALADPTKYDAVRPEAFAGKSGLIATPALRVMSATDEFMRTLNAAGALAVAARREARSTGKTVQEILSQPPEHVLRFAQDAADAAVFEGKGSPVSEGIIKWRNLINSSQPAEKAVGVAANVLFPFVHIPEQILIRGTRMLPVVNEASTIMKIRKGMQSGDQQVVRDAVGRYVLTTGLLLAAGSQVLAGNITGMGPKDPQKRAALDAARDANGNKVWQAHSVRTGDRWIDYTNLGPVAIPLAALSNAHEAYLESGKKPDANVVADIFNRVAATMLDATYIKSFGDLMTGFSEGNLIKAGGSLIGNTATRFVPFGGALSQVERSMDQDTKDPRNLPEYVASRVPGASELVPDKASPFGGSVQQPQDIAASLAPFKTSAPGTPELVAKAFVDAGLGAPGAPSQIRIRNQMTNNLSPPIVLKDEEKKRYVQIMGDRLRERVTPMVSSAGWQSRPIQARQKALESQLQAARDYAETQIYRGLDAEERTRRMSEGRRQLTPTPIR